MTRVVPIGNVVATVKAWGEWRDGILLDNTLFGRKVRNDWVWYTLTHLKLLVKELAVAEGLSLIGATYYYAVLCSAQF